MYTRSKQNFSTWWHGFSWMSIPSPRHGNCILKKKNVRGWIFANDKKTLSLGKASEFSSSAPREPEAGGLSSSRLKTAHGAPQNYQSATKSSLHLYKHHTNKISLSLYIYKSLKLKVNQIGRNALNAQGNWPISSSRRRLYSSWREANLPSRSSRKISMLADMPARGDRI